MLRSIHSRLVEMGFLACNNNNSEQICQMQMLSELTAAVGIFDDRVVFLRHWWPGTRSEYHETTAYVEIIIFHQ